MEIMISIIIPTIFKIIKRYYLLTLFKFIKNYITSYHFKLLLRCCDYYKFCQSSYILRMFYFLLHISFSKTTNLINLSAIDHFLLFLCFILSIFYLYNISIKYIYRYLCILIYTFE